MASESATPVKEPISDDTTKPAETADAAAYDPFNPDDSPDEQTEHKVVKFEIKSTSVKLANTVLNDSFEKDPVSRDIKSEAVEEKPPVVASKQQPETVVVKVEPKEVKKENSESGLKSNGESNGSSRKDSKREHKSESSRSSGDKNGQESKIKRAHSPPRPSREKKATPSRSSKSPKRDRERDKGSAKTSSRTRRSRSGSKSRRSSRGKRRTFFCLSKSFHFSS